VSFETDLKDLLRQVLREELPPLLAGATAGPTSPPRPSTDLLTIEEVATRCKARPPAVRGWIRSGRLVAKKAGHRHLVSLEDLERFLATAGQRREPPITDADHVTSVLNRLNRER
jgi:excisionase family DNA binding protein